MDEREAAHAAFRCVQPNQIQAAHVGAMEQVSEVDLFECGRSTRNAHRTSRGSSSSGRRGERSDWASPNPPILVHFGDSDFEAKYHTLIEKIGEWRATAGRVESIDLRFKP